MKKIKQIAISRGDNEIPDYVYALTEDDELYYMSIGEQKWHSLPAIPD